MGVEIEDICSSLDVLLLDMLHLTQKEISCKLQLEEVLKSGYINMAKARYIMGNNSVSLLQVPSSVDTSALTTIGRVGENDRYPEFLLKNVFPSCENVGMESTSLRQRNRNVNSDVPESEEEPETFPVISDPIKWFGILVPPCLRQTQNDFKLALELLVDCANIQSELLAKRKKYTELLACKNDILSRETSNSV